MAGSLFHMYNMHPSLTGVLMVKTVYTILTTIW